LYIGINNLLPYPEAPYQKWFYDLFKSKQFSSFTILEIYKPNADFAREYFESQSIPMRVVNGDVRQASKLFDPHEFDVSMWWHGPEHVEDVDAALKEI
jgi:hypothetical protein